MRIILKFIYVTLYLSIFFFIFYIFLYLKEPALLLFMINLTLLITFPFGLIVYLIFFLSMYFNLFVDSLIFILIILSFNFFLGYYQWFIWLPKHSSREIIK